MARSDRTHLVGLPEAADRLGLHRATVNDMVHDGRISARRVGPHWFIAESDLAEFAAQYQRPKNSPRRKPKAAHPSVQILALLADWGTATVAELDAVVDMHEGNIRKHLNIAEAQGLAERDEYGTWTLTSSGRHGLQQAG